MKRITLTLATVLSLAFTQVTAQDFNKGMDAYNAGDYATALQEWKPLAEQGNANAQYYLGFMYKNGNGVPQNNAETVKWLQLAAEQGYAPAQSFLGFMYENGFFVLKDYIEAVKWYQLAAEQGDSSSQFNLGTMYSNSNSILKDYAVSLKWYRLAAEQGNAPAQSIIGGMYEFGKGVLQDNLTAHMWYNISSANGSEGAGRSRDELAELMTPEAIEKATAMARECMKSNYKKCGY